jgi:hypothetical protein
MRFRFYKLFDRTDGYIYIKFSSKKKNEHIANNLKNTLRLKRNCVRRFARRMPGSLTGMNSQLQPSDFLKKLLLASKKIKTRSNKYVINFLKFSVCK